MTGWEKELIISLDYSSANLSLLSSLFTSLFPSFLLLRLSFAPRADPFSYLESCGEEA